MRKLILTTALVFLTVPAIAESQRTADYTASKVAAIEPSGYADDNRHGIATSSQIVKKLTAKKTDSASYISPNIDLSIHFETGSATMTEQSRTQLVELAQALKNPDLLFAEFVIEGHTDNVGDAGLNKALSKKRAKSVVHALQKDFDVDTDNISIKGFGESKPVASNDSEQGRAENRRVTIVRVK